jgi:hypothetical protein
MPRRTKKPKLEGTEGQGDAPPAYMLLAHGVVRPAYSVFKLDPYAGGGKRAAPSHDLARLKCKHGKSFVPVSSKHGAWIVSVSGSSTKSLYGPETIVFDTETHAVLTGPNPGLTKQNPVLLAVGERIYALSERPSVNGRVDACYDGRLDFLPWFEVLDLSNAKVVGGRLTDCQWKPLPTPPFFPWGLNLEQYISRTTTGFRVTSYASIGCYILVSIHGQQATYAFNTDTEQWRTVDEKNSLPFFGRAIPHGPELFLGVSRATRAINAYKINGIAGESLAIMEIPVFELLLGDDEEVIIKNDDFLSLGIDRGFCSVSCWRVDKSWDPPFFRAHIRLIGYGTKDFMGECLDVSKRWKQLYEIHDTRRALDSPCVAGVFFI